MIPLTVLEVRRLVQVLDVPAAHRGFHLHWSRWRQVHQATAKRCHAACQPNRW